MNMGTLDLEMSRNFPTWEPLAVRLSINCLL
jgi:hypothetical protein